MERRTLLATAASPVGAVPTVGCLGDDDRSEEPLPEDEINLAYDVCEYSPSLSFDEVRPDGQTAIAVHCTSASEAGSAFALDDLTDEARSTVETFVDETAFEEAILLYVETAAPNTCYRFQLGSLELTPERVVTGSATARDASEEHEGCGAMLTQPSILLRIRSEPELPTHAEIDVTDGWGETKTVHSSTPP